MSEETLLPQNEMELDALVDSVTKDFGLPPGDETYEAIATAIMHMPPTQVFVPISHFATAARRFWAAKSAYTRLMGFQEKRKKADEEKKTLTVVPKEQDAPGEPVQNA